MTANQQSLMGSFNKNKGALKTLFDENNGSGA